MFNIKDVIKSDYNIDVNSGYVDLEVRRWWGI